MQQFTIFSPPGPAGRSLKGGRGGRVWAAAVLAVLCLAAALWCANFFLIARAVSAELARDPRNGSFLLQARWQHYLPSSALVLDLQEVRGAVPLDLCRGLFQAAACLYRDGRRFPRVHLARRGETVFILTGEDFAEIGAQYLAQENPVYMLRTLPEKLLRPDGTPAFPHWEGGILGVAAAQFEDLNRAARAWAKEP